MAMMVGLLVAYVDGLVPVSGDALFVLCWVIALGTIGTMLHKRSRAIRSRRG